MPPILKEIPVNKILVDDKKNSRGTDIGSFNIQELASDIKLRGLIQHPVVVTEGDHYRLIAGFRRMHAIKYLKWETVHAVINDDLDSPEKQIAANLAENIQRQTINMVQEAKAIQFLMNHGKTIEEMAKICNRSLRWVEVRKNLMELPEEVHTAVALGIVDAGQIQSLHTIRNVIGESMVLLKLQAIKDARKRGERLALETNTQRDSKRHRNRTDIFEMQDVVRSLLGNGVVTRALAWAGGEISSMDFLRAIEEECEKKGIPYIQPTKVP